MVASGAVCKESLGVLVLEGPQLAWGWGSLGALGVPALRALGRGSPGVDPGPSSQCPGSPVLGGRWGGHCLCERERRPRADMEAGDMRPGTPAVPSV